MGTRLHMLFLCIRGKSSRRGYGGTWQVRIHAQDCCVRYSVAACLKWYTQSSNFACLSDNTGYFEFCYSKSKFAVSDVADWGGETQKPGELLYTNQ